MKRPLAPESLAPDARIFAAAGLATAMLTVALVVLAGGEGGRLEPGGLLPYFRAHHTRYVASASVALAWMVVAIPFLAGLRELLAAQRRALGTAALLLAALAWNAALSRVLAVIGWIGGIAGLLTLAVYQRPCSRSCSSWLSRPGAAGSVCSSSGGSGVRKARIAHLLVAFLALGSVSVAAAAYPEKPLRLVVPFAPGGGADALARAVAQGMARSLGQPVLVESRPGGDATLAGAFVAHAAPDGYTLLFASNTGLSGAPFLHKDIGYDPVRDFTPVSMLGFFPYFLVANKDFAPRTLRELVDYARAHPGGVNYASGNAMGIVATAQLAAAEKLDMVHVPYKGEAPAIPDLVTNRVQFIFTTGFIIPYVKEGKVRAIAAMLDERSTALPGVPTVVESGFPALAIRGWAAIVAPAGLARDVQARLNRAVRESLEMEGTKAALATQGFPGKASTPQELADFIRAQLASWRSAVQAAGLEPE